MAKTVYFIVVVDEAEELGVEDHNIVNILRIWNLKQPLKLLKKQKYSKYILS